MKFTASRLSEGNKIFPAEIHIESSGLTVKIPGLFSGNSKYFDFTQIASVDIETPMIGYSTITFYGGGTSFSAHGFKVGEVKQIQRAVEKGKQNQTSKQNDDDDETDSDEEDNDEETDSDEVKIKRLELEASDSDQVKLKRLELEEKLNRDLIGSQQEEQKEKEEQFQDVKKIPLIKLGEKTPEIAEIMYRIVTLANTAIDGDEYDKESRITAYIGKLQEGIRKLNYLQDKQALDEKKYFELQLFTIENKWNQVINRIKKRKLIRRYITWTVIVIIVLFILAHIL